MTDDERTWCQRAHSRGGSFVAAFAEACLHADPDNFQKLKPVLTQMMEKYPEYLPQVAPPFSEK